MKRSDIIAVYADGGVVGRNPSTQGGTWAWCHVDAAGRRVAEQSGVITPAQAALPTITNNLTEMHALVQGLLALPAGWAGTVFSDSQITLGRLFWQWSWKNIPPWLVEAAREALARLDWERCTPVLLDGHPTRAQLAEGRGKRGNPVSEHNVWADAACGTAAQTLLEVSHVPLR